MMASTCLVTGGAGFIGSHLVRLLDSKGFHVRILDDFSTGTLENLTGVQERIEILRGDICDKKLITTAVKDVKYIFHLAAMISVQASMQDPELCFEVNTYATNSILFAASHTEVERVIIASSAAVYGDNADLPAKEDAMLKPLSPYAASKAMCESLASLYTQSYSLPVSVLRFFNVYGPYQNPGSPYAAVIPLFIRRILEGHPPMIFGDGKQTRDFIYVADVVRACFLAATGGKVDGIPVNVCTGNPVSLLELVEHLRYVLPDVGFPTFADPKPGDIIHSWGDPSIASSVMEFQSEMTLLEGLTHTVDWMKM
jgi:nucleoside-diphosphate-sugar epimerase